MIPGKTLPKPVCRIWAASYMDSNTEIIEIRTEMAGHPDYIDALYHKEYPIGTSLADFLYVELKAFEQHLQQLNQHIEEINAGHDVDRHFAEIFDITMYWMHQSAIFAPLGAAIERLHLVYDRREKLASDEIARQMTYYTELQPRLRFLAEHFFEADSPVDMAVRYFKQQQEHGNEMYPQLTFGSVRFGVVSKGANGFFPYDNLLNTFFPSTREDERRDDFVDFIAETLNTSEPEDLVHFVLYQYICQNLRFRICKYCGRYFGIVGNPKSEYCDRLIDGSVKTCKETGSFRLYEKRKFENPAVREYKRSYKAHNARIRYGTMTREEFSAWSLQAREKRDLCVAGKLSLEDFVSWLDSDRQS